MIRRSVGWSAWGLFALQAALLLGASAIELREEGWEPAALLFIALALALPGVGALILSQRPDNPIGFLLLAPSLYIGATGLSVITEGLLPEQQQAWLEWAANALFTPTVWPLLTFLPLLFPDGLPSRRWLWVAWCGAIGIALLTVGNALNPNLLEDRPNPAALGSAALHEDIVIPAGVLFFFVAIVASVVAAVRRFRRSRGEKRLQLKWFAFAMVAAVLGYVGALVSELLGNLDVAPIFLTLGLILLPAAIGIAVLKYRLYDIDLVINRTLVYGALTAILGAVYVAGVVGLPRLLPLAQDSDLVVAGSTLAVAALFSPLRKRTQAFVDRRFYRRRYDAARTIEAFSQRLRDQVDLESLSTELAGIVRDTLQPASVGVWLREREGMGR